MTSWEEQDLPPGIPGSFPSVITSPTASNRGRVSLPSSEAELHPFSPQSTFRTVSRSLDGTESGRVHSLEIGDFEVFPIRDSLDMLGGFDEPTPQPEQTVLGVVKPQKPAVKKAGSHPIIGADIPCHPDSELNSTNPSDHTLHPPSIRSPVSTRPIIHTPSKRMAHTIITQTSESNRTQIITPKRRVRADTIKEYKVDIVFLVSQPLVFSSSSPDQRPIPALNHDREESALVRACQDAQKYVRYARRTASVSSLRRILTEKTRILHYCGHGIPSSLVFEDDDDIGFSKMITAETLQKLVGAGSDSGLQLVVVSACHSEVAGNAFVNAGVPHVVAVKRNADLNDFVTKHFTEHFYGAILANETVAHAFEIAQSAVMASFKSDALLQREHDKFILLPRRSNHDVCVLDDLEDGEFEQKELKSVKSFARPPTLDQCIARNSLQLSIMQAIQHYKLVVLMGRSGVGKSHLARVVCQYLWEREQFKDGIFSVDCKSLQGDSSVICRTVSRYLQEQHLGYEQVTRVGELSMQIGNRHMLLILDDIHLFGETSARENLVRQYDLFVSSLLSKTDNVKVLMTIRDPRLLVCLGYREKQPIIVKPLDNTSAVKLFVRSSPKPIRTELHLYEHPIIRECAGVPGLLVFGSTVYFNHDTLDDDDILAQVRERKAAMGEERSRGKKSSELWEPRRQRLSIKHAVEGNELPAHERKQGRPDRKSVRARRQPPRTATDRIPTNPNDIFTTRNNPRSRPAAVSFSISFSDSENTLLSPTESTSRSGSGTSRSVTQRERLTESLLRRTLDFADPCAVQFWKEEVGWERYVMKDIAMHIMVRYYNRVLPPHLVQMRPISESEKHFLTYDLWDGLEVDDERDSISLRDFAKALKYLDQCIDVISHEKVKKYYFRRDGRHCIAGLLEKKKARRICKMGEEGTFLFRFSGTEAGNLVLVVNRGSRVVMYLINVDLTRKDSFSLMTQGGKRNKKIRRTRYSSLRRLVRDLAFCEHIWTPNGVVPGSNVFG